MDRTPEPELLLEQLDAEQREAVEATRGPVCILAGAGTGKTRTITHRIGYSVLSGVIPAKQVLALTFTTRAAAEMRSRLRELGCEGVQTRTFHAAALRQLRYFWPQVVGGQVPRVLPTKAAQVSQAMARLRLRADRPVVRDLAAEIEWAKVTQVAPDDYPRAAAAARRTAIGDLTPDQVAKVYHAYEEVKQAQGHVDFEDVLLLAVALLEEQPTMVESVREQYRHFVVDEYQDVSPLQQRLLELWLGDRDDICVVGDANQTIYSFTGASPSFLLDFPKRYPQAHVVRLVRDYRSTPQVVELANAVLAKSRGETSRAAFRLSAQRPPGPEPSFTEHPDEPAEAVAVARRIAELVAGGCSVREVAVLYRVNAQSEVYEQALADASIPYVVRGAERFFERPEVRQAVVLLRGAARAEADRTDSRIIEQPPHASGLLREGAVAVLASAGYTQLPPSGSGAVRARWESLAAIVELAAEVEQRDPGAGLRELVVEIEDRMAAQHAPAVEGVTLASLHAAKGLEWTAVFLVGLCEGTLPISYAQSVEQVEEERRLLYVGVTRAREHLGLSWALARSPGARAQRRRSHFLDGLAPDVAPRAGRPDRSGKSARSRRLASCRVCGRALTTATERKLRHCSNCVVDVDLELFERLREWRLAVARAASVPAFVVFTDATLRAIAQDGPTSRDELALIPGIGSTKLERYGDPVLSVVRGEQPAAASLEPDRRRD